jgi:hypothetical protein
VNDHDLLLTMTICKLLGREVGPGDVEVAFKQAREALKALRDWSQPAETTPIPPRS